MENKNFIKGAIWNTLGSMMYGVNSFIMLALVGRIGTVENAGDFGIAFTTAQLLYIIGIFGVSHYQQTDYEEKYSFAAYTSVKIVSSIFMFLGCALSIYMLHFSGRKALYTIVLTVLMMLNAIADMFQSLFFQKNRLDLSGQALFFRTLGALIVFIAVMLVTENVLISIELQICANFVITAYYAIKYTPKMVTHDSIFAPNAIASETKGLFIECIPLFISMFLMNIVINIPKYGIELLMDNAAQGYYNMIFISVQIVNLCSPFLFKPFLNKYSEIFRQNNWRGLHSMLKKQISIVVVITVLCCVAAFAFGTQALGLIYDKDLYMYRGELTMLIVGSGFLTCSQLFYYIYVVLRQQNRIMCIYCIGLIASVVLSGVLIGSHNIWGAVFSFLFTQIVVLLLYIIFFIKFINKIKRN